MSQLCYSLSLSFSIRVTSEVGWATLKKKKKKKQPESEKRKKKKKGSLQLPHSHPPTPPLSSSFPSLLYSPPSFVKNSRHQSSELSLFKWPVFEPCPRQNLGSTESTERRISLGSRPLTKELILWFSPAGQKE